jgi:DNA polymerase
MGTDDDFDIEYVHRLVDQVVGDAPDSGPEPSPPLHLPFNFYDTKLLEELVSLLPGYGIEQADTQVILDSLRSKLVVDTDRNVLRNIHTLSLNCKKCPALQNPILPLGNIADPDIVFILDHPEEDYPRPLSSVLDKVQIDNSRTMLTFTTRCRSIPGRQISGNELSNCSPYLFSEIQILSPKLIVPLGNAVGSLLLGPLKISEDHGSIFWVGPWAIMPVFAPGYLSRKDTAETEFIADFDKMKRFVYG